MGSKDAMALAFNLWMHRYTTNPEEFEREWEAVSRFISERDSGREPSYGEVCAEYLRTLIAAIEAK